MSLPPGSPPLPRGEFDVLLADPPWEYKVWSKRGKGRTSAHHYRTLSDRALLAMRYDIIEVSAADSALFLWVTFPKLPVGLELMAAWGFEYVTVAWEWYKSNRHALHDGTIAEAWSSSDEAPVAVRECLETGQPMVVHSGRFYALHMGMGHYTRGGGEICLFGKRGKMSVAARDVRGQIVAPVGARHSEKPAQQYDMIDRLYPHLGRRLELFARSEHPGWVSWGDELAAPLTDERRTA